MPLHRGLMTLEEYDAPRAVRRHQKALVRLPSQIGQMLPPGWENVTAFEVVVRAEQPVGPRGESPRRRVLPAVEIISPGSPDEALAGAAAHVVDWEGGTRIGDSLDEFVRGWGRRGGVVVICSDGLDRGDPDTLDTALERLTRPAAVDDGHDGGRAAHRRAVVRPRPEQPRRARGAAARAA